MQWRGSCCLFISWQVIHPVFTHLMMSYWNKNLIAWLSSVLGRGQPLAAGFVLQGCGLQCLSQSTGHVLLRSVCTRRLTELHWGGLQMFLYNAEMSCYTAKGVALFVCTCWFLEPFGLTSCQECQPLLLCCTSALQTGSSGFYEAPKRGQELVPGIWFSWVSC